MRRFDKIALIGMSCEGNGSLGTLIDERQANLDALRVSGFLYRARQRYKGFCRVDRPSPRGAVGGFHAIVRP